MYTKLPNLVLAFHGCDLSVFESVIYKHKHLKNSENDHDWLGHGAYFWEHNLERAWEWAKDGVNNPKSSIKEPTVIGAIIDLGNCLNLMDSQNIKILKKQFEIFNYEIKYSDTMMPLNKNKSGDNDLLLRYLDCAVIENLHQERKINKQDSFDSVRGVFFEGNEIYKTSGFREKTHIQICVRNPNCIKGYFVPQSKDSVWSIP